LLRDKSHKRVRRSWTTPGKLLLKIVKLITAVVMMVVVEERKEVNKVEILPSALVLERRSLSNLSRHAITLRPLCLSLQNKKQVINK